jgi:signal transduction histidine kinase
MTANPQAQTLQAHDAETVLAASRRHSLQRLYLIAAVSIVFISALAVVAAIEPRYKELSTIVTPANTQNFRGQPTLEMSALLGTIGWSLTTWAAYFTAFETLIGASGIVVGLFIIWKKPDHWFPVLMGVGMATSFTGPVYNLEALSNLHSAWDIPARLLTIVGFIGFAGGFALFPNGRFVPAWNRYLGVIWVAYVVVTELFAPDWSFPRRIDVPNSARGIVLAFMTLVWMVMGIASQTYRYFWRSTKLERQQTKWVVGGLVWFFIFAMPFLAIPAITSQPLLPPPYTPASLTVLIVFVSIFYSNCIFMLIAIAFAILRYRLWDIDIVFNRTLVYAILTVLIVVTYVVVVGSLSALFNAEGVQIFSLVATGIVAISFHRLRERVQRSINRLMFGQRDEPQTLLSDLFRQLQTAILPEDLLQTSTATISTSLKIPYVAIAVQQGANIFKQAEYGRNGFPTQTFALIHQNETVGELIVGQRSPNETLNPADQSVLASIAGQLGAVVYAVRLQSDLQTAREKLVIAREEERRRLRRDLHDGLGPALASQTLKIDAALDLLIIDPNEAKSLLTDVKAQSQKLVTDVRRLVYELRPPALDEIGLVAALTSAITQMRATESGLSIQIETPLTLPDLPAAVEVAAYRITMEAVTNVIKHAEARNCAVRFDVTEKPTQLRLEIQDDGKGLPTPVISGIGLHSMRERAEELGGAFLVDRAIQGGAWVTVTIPLHTIQPTRWGQDHVEHAL